MTRKKPRPIPRFVCPACGRGFRTQEAIRLHVQVKHLRPPAAMAKEDGMEVVKK